MINYLTSYKTFFTAVCLASCFFLSGCENDQKTIDDWSKDKLMTEEATDIETFLSQEGRMKARLTAPLMIRTVSMVDTLYVEFPQSLHVDFYNEDTVIETRLDSKYGKYYEALNKVYLRDSVVVINIQGDTLKAPDLWWNQNTGKFYTDKYAIYHGTNKNIYGGEGLEATQDLSSIIFKKPTGTVKVAESGSLQ